MEDEELGLGNIMSEEEAESLFDTGDGSQDSLEEGEKKETKETTEVDPDNLFESPESVGSGKEDTQEQEGADTDNVEDSPKANVIYSSIASTLQEEGILSELGEEDLKEISDADSLIKAFEKQIKAQLDERQKRIDEALNYGVEPSEIKNYENTIQYLETITEEKLKEESDEGNTLRKQLIYNSFINSGIDKEKAAKLTERSFATGADVEDAIEALSTNKKQYNENYQNLIKKAKEEAEAEEREREQLAEKFKKDILGTENIFDGIPLDKSVRQKVYENLSKPVYKDKEGYSYTAIQKYELENREDFLKKLGVLFTLTDGFQNVDKLVQVKVKKEIKKSRRDLEHVINNTARNSDGSLRYISGASGEDYEHSTLKLDLDI